MKKIMSMMLMLMVSIAIFAKGEIKTVVFTTNPQMHCANCENKIKNHLKFEKGIKKIETSVEHQYVAITYDSEKTNPEKLQAALKKINYEVKVIDPKSQAMKTIKKLDCDKACNMGNVDKTPVRVEGRTVKRAAAIQKDAVKSVQKNATKEVKRVPVGEKLVTKEVVKEKK